MKNTLTVNTPAGVFTRTTGTAYRFVAVWNSPRAKSIFDRNSGNESGVYQRWVKDRGYGVTWHSKRPTPKRYDWDQAATLVGVYEL